MAFDQFRGRLLSPAAVADDVGVSVCQIHRWITAGKIVATRLGHRITRVDGDSLAQFLTNSMESPGYRRGKSKKTQDIH